MTLFLDTLKSYRKGYYQQNGKFPKPDRKGMVWAYPWAIERQYSSYIQDYMKNITTLYGGWLEDNYELFVREVGSRADGLRHDEWYEEMDAWNEELREIQANNPDFRNKSMLAYLTTIGYTADDFNQAQFFKFAKQAIDSPFIPDEALTTPLVKAWAQNNRVLITSLSDEYIKKANLIVSDAVQNGMLYKDLTDELQKLDKNLGKTRARLIARDQIGKLNGNLSQDRSEAAGLDMYSWLTAKDERVRGNPGGKYPKAIPSHYIMEGKLCRWDNPTVWSLDKGETWINRDSRAPRVHPGQEIQCFLGDTKFMSHVPIEKLYRRRYKGELTKIISTDGSSILTTPNHPILRSDGLMQEAHLINKGDKLLKTAFQSSTLVEADTEDGMSFVNMFKLFHSFFGSDLGTTTTKDFHGDGIIDEKVNVVNIEGFLGDYVETPILKESLKLFFTNADTCITGLMTKCNIEFLLPSYLDTPNSLVSFACKLNTLLRSGVLHSGEHSLTSITMTTQDLIYKSGDYTSINTIFNTESLGTATSRILLDDLFLRKICSLIPISHTWYNSETELSDSLADVIGVRIEASGNFRKAFTSDISFVEVADVIVCKSVDTHVYNLQNNDGWYSVRLSNGDYIIVANCRCVQTPYWDEIVKQIDGEIIEEVV